MIMQAVGVAEDNIFKKRKEDDVRGLNKHGMNVEALDSVLSVCIVSLWWFFFCLFVFVRKILSDEIKKNERG